MKKYKNIVFDMGRVLVDYDGRRCILPFSSDPAVVKEVRDVVFGSGEWIMLDAGLLSEEEALESMLSHCSSDEVRRVARESFWSWDKYNLYPIEGMDSLVSDLKTAGYGLYILSNASIRMPAVYREHTPCWQLFDGVFFSAEHGCLKPQTEIYEKFFREFGLAPTECFFVDDLERNIRAAAACGMEGLQAPWRNADRLRESLTRLEILGYNF